MNKITDRPHTADTGQRSVLRNAPPDRIPDRPRPGRGAISNRNGRFERLRGVAIDDGWRTGRENADAGVDAGVTTDVDFHPRPYQIPDLGADEYWPPGTLTFIHLPLVMR